MTYNRLIYQCIFQLIPYFILNLSHVLESEWVPTVFSSVNLSCCFSSRSEFLAQVSSVRESWFSAVVLAAQRRSWVKEQLRQRRIYHRGSKLLRRLLRDVAPLLPPTGPALCTLQQLRSCADDHQVSTDDDKCSFSSCCCSLFSDLFCQ